jgi:hypothetical protein
LAERLDMQIFTSTIYNCGSNDSLRIKVPAGEKVHLCGALNKRVIPSIDWPSEALMRCRRAKFRFRPVDGCTIPKGLAPLAA